MKFNANACYEHASSCIQHLLEANACETRGHRFSLKVSMGERALQRAQVAFGDPEVGHQRVVRVAREALSLLKRAVGMLQTEAPIDDVAAHLNKTSRKLRQLQMATLTQGKVAPHGS